MGTIYPFSYSIFFGILGYRNDILIQYLKKAFDLSQVRVSWFL
jgi:fucose permease